MLSMLLTTPTSLVTDFQFQPLLMLQMLSLMTQSPGASSVNQGLATPFLIYNSRGGVYTNVRASHPSDGVFSHLVSPDRGYRGCGALPPTRSDGLRRVPHVYDLRLWRPLVGQLAAQLAPVFRRVAEVPHAQRHSNHHQNTRCRNESRVSKEVRRYNTATRK